jgi:hypothetical protein
MNPAPARALTISETESPRLKWEDVRQEDRDKACKLRDVFMPTLEKYADENRPLVDREAELIDRYTRVFGHPCSGQWVMELYFRFIKQDASRGGWMNLSLYLPENARCQTKAPRAIKSDFDHEDLGVALKSILAPRGTKKNHQPGRLTKRQKQSIWVATHAHLNCVAAPESKEREAASRSVRQYLLAAVPMLAATPEALKRNFNRKCAALDASNGKPSAIVDRRELDSGWYRGPEISEEAHKAIVAHAVFRCGGRVAQAWRDYLGDRVPGVVAESSLVDYYAANAVSKSHVPRRLRECVKYQVAAMQTIHHGIYQHEQTAHLILDNSRIFAGEVWSSDDATLPVYWLAGTTLMRGQFLVTADRRSRRVLGFCLIPEKSYDSISIRNHIVVTADSHGLPKYMEWERGIWQKTKLLKGDTNADFVPPEEAELGLRELGIQFVHRRSPKAKIVERVIGALQDLMEGEPGYCGRNEQTERFEEFYKLKADCEAGRADPREHFYTFEQWEGRLAELCAEYNRTPCGRDTALAGMSPDQAYEAFQNPSDPAIKFDAGTRYLLSTHRRVVRINAEGIDFSVGKRQFLYRGGRSGEFIGKKMLVWFDPESPDIAYVTDLKRQNPFAVERVNPISPVGAAREEISDEMHKLREHQKPIRTLYRALKAKFKQTFRKNIVTADIVETGRAFTQAAEEIKEKRNALRSVRRLAADNGIRLPAVIKDICRVKESVERTVARNKQDSQAISSDVVPAPTVPDFLKEPASPPPSKNLYLTLCAQIEQINPGFDRHAIELETIGCGTLLAGEMKSQQLKAMIDKVNCLLSDLQKAAV